MPVFELKNVDPEDIDDVLELVQLSFNIRFEGNELAHISTFGQLCDYITAKVPLDNSSSCTSQQAFYKLRQSLAATLPVAPGNIAPTTLLTDLLPPRNRKQIVWKVETSLGLSINLLGPPDWLLNLLICALLASLAGFSLSWQVGLGGIILSILGFRLADWFTSNNLQLETVGQLAEQMTRNNYVHSRRNPNTFNRDEIGKVLTDLFSTELSLDKAALTREARFA